MRHVLIRAGERMKRLAPRAGVCLLLRRNQRLRIVNTHGQQVVDLWAWVPRASGAPEQISQAHTRSLNGRLSLEPGDTIYSAYRRPLLTLTEDTSPGRHDLLGHSCDRVSYVEGDGIDDGWEGLHGHSLNSCCENLWTAQEAAGLTPLLGYPRGDPALGEHATLIPYSTPVTKHAVVTASDRPPYIPACPPHHNPLRQAGSCQRYSTSS